MKGIQAAYNKEYCERWQVCKAVNIFHSVKGIIRYLQWRVFMKIKHSALTLSAPILLKSISILSFHLRHLQSNIFLTGIHINISYQLVTSHYMLHISPISSPLTNSSLDVLTPHVPIREVPLSNLGLETHYLD
jgi:hypothetical protein